MVNAEGSGQTFKLGPLAVYHYRPDNGKDTHIKLISYPYKDEGIRTQIVIYDMDDDIAAVTINEEEVDHLILALTILRNGGNFDGDSTG